MCRLFTFITCCIVIAAAGAAGDSGIVKVKRGENFSLCVRTSEPKIVSRFTVLRNGTQEVFRYCSPEEQNLGCKPTNSERCSLQIIKENISVTFLHASTSDEGVYDVNVIDDKNIVIHQKFTVALTEQLPSSINPEPPSIHPFTTPALSTKAGETFGTNGPISTVSTERNRNVTWGIKGGLTALILVIVVTGIICCKKKNIAEDDGEDPGKGTLLNSDTKGAGEPATDESFEILVQSDHSVDKKRTEDKDSRNNKG